MKYDLLLPAIHKIILHVPVIIMAN